MMRAPATASSWILASNVPGTSAALKEPDGKVELWSMSVVVLWGVQCPSKLFRSQTPEVVRRLSPGSTLSVLYRARMTDATKGSAPHRTRANQGAKPMPQGGL
ncbi:hypothetical protein FB451DRAFT_1184142 [Mycena latifolia]|nr:hypothetical protein FB451DRAFT_1184142 [Mycena latifolia]